MVQIMEAYTEGMYGAITVCRDFPSSNKLKLSLIELTRNNFMI